MVARWLNLSDQPLGKVVMVMGTSSSAGKSLITTALCRSFARCGLRVAPFKSQNMSNNASVCADGGEIGRSQALQAIAAGVQPTTDMNPILLKPEGDTRSQVVVNGKPTPPLEAQAYFRERKKLWPVATAALDRLRSQYDLVVIEGAGSPAELNLADVEMVNMSVARYCQAPVLLVGDIERGGVFAQLLGTLWLLPEEDRRLICGLLVNKFRGDLSLFDRGVEILQERGGVPVLGVLPWVAGLNLPEEDAVALSDPLSFAQSSVDDAIDVAVIHLPHIANFDDFDPLVAETNVALRYVQSLEQLGSPDVVILPGTKNTLGDLQWLKDQGLAQRLSQLAEEGVEVIGICGGYQILGQSIDNPERLESGVPHATGLGLLPVETRYHASKQTLQTTFQVTGDAIAPGSKGLSVSGYEIHVGQTVTTSPWLTRAEDVLSSVPSAVDRSPSDGASAREGKVWGCYLHGLFHNDEFRQRWLVKLGVDELALSGSGTEHQLQQDLDRLADHLEASIDLDALQDIINQASSA